MSHEPPRFVRARQPGQIQERTEDILRGAQELIMEKGQENVSLKDIADRIGSAKSNLYRYFESREHIYLVILQRQGVLFEKKVIPPLEKLAQKGSIPAVAKIVTNGFVKTVGYSSLIPVFSTILEQNLSPELVVNFRSVFLERRRRVADALAKALPKRTPDEFMPPVLYIFTQAAGLWPLCHTSASAKETVSAPEHAHLNLDFEKEMTRAVGLILTP